MNPRANRPAALLLVILGAAYLAWAVITRGCPDALFTVSGAKNVRRVNPAKGRYQITYHLQREFPPAGVAGEISARLERKGWRPRRENLSQPGIETTIARGWREYTDATQKPPRRVRVWEGEWSDKNGNMVLYCLRYADATRRPADLAVSGQYLSAAAAKEMLLRQARRAAQSPRMETHLKEQQGSTEAEETEKPGER